MAGCGAWHGQMNAMSEIERASQWIMRNGIIAIVRGDFSIDDMLRIGESLLAVALTAMEAGAQFVISPNVDPESASYARTQDLLHLLGVFTATEAQTAFAAGCQMMKLFPMHTGGPAHFKALRAPLDNIEFIPTRGVSLECIGEYAHMGTVAVGLGSKLISSRAQTAGDLTSRAKALRQAWEAGKNA